MAEISHDDIKVPCHSSEEASNSSGYDSPAAPPRIRVTATARQMALSVYPGVSWRAKMGENSPQIWWRFTYQEAGESLRGWGIVEEGVGKGGRQLRRLAGNPGTRYHCKFLYRWSVPLRSAAETLQQLPSPSNLGDSCETTTEIMEPSKIKKRAARACSFCRGRKVRCIVTGPSEACTNCKYHEKPCTRTGIW